MWRGCRLLRRQGSPPLRLTRTRRGLQFRWAPSNATRVVRPRAWLSTGSLWWTGALTPINSQKWYPWSLWNSSATCLAFRQKIFSFARVARLAAAHDDADVVGLGRWHAGRSGRDAVGRRRGNTGRDVTTRRPHQQRRHNTARQRSRGHRFRRAGRQLDGRDLAEGSVLHHSNVGDFPGAGVFVVPC